MVKVYCETCKKRCRGNVLHAGEKYFHKDCFRCSDCKCNLEGGGYFTKNNKYYCQKDYQSLTTPKCKVCLGDLNGEIVSALSYSFHKGCFICSHCKTPFHPGHRVTVWKDQFFCIVCSKSLSIFTTNPSALPMHNSNSNSVSNGGGMKHRLSFADQTVVSQLVEGSRENLRCFSPDACSQSASSTATIPKANGGAPKILKSSLRRSTAAEAEEQAPQKCIPTDHAGQAHKPYLTHNGVTTLTTSASADQTDFANQHFSPRSQTFNSDQTRSKNYSGRHPLSEFGRFYNQSYMSMAEQPVRRSTNLYRRSVTLTPSTSGSFNKLHHFHIPEGNFRYSLPPNHLGSSSVSRFSRSFTSSLRDALNQEPVLRKAPTLNGNHHEYLHQSSHDFTSSSPQLAPRHLSYRDGMELNTSCSGQTLEANIEARRLASFPGGQPRDSDAPAAIERYDWPAPASTAVVLAELKNTSSGRSVRERRHRRREEMRLNGSCVDGNEDVDSQENLSLDASIDSPPSDQVSLTSGIGRAILLEEEEQKRRKARSHQRGLVDPVSASRTPNANAEPPFKTRYPTHSFASPSRESTRTSISPHRLGYSLNFVNLGARVWTVGGSGYRDGLHSPRNGLSLRPGYTAGQLTEQSPKSANLSGAKFLSSPRLNGRQNGTIFEESGQSSRSSPRTNSKDHHNSLNPKTSQTIDGNGIASRSDLKCSTSVSAGYPGVIYSSYPSNTFKKPTFIPFQEISYQQLVSRKGPMLRGLDSKKLEMYLSDAEFEQKFAVNRAEFYLLPEWKQNDLKRRLNLF